MNAKNQLGFVKSTRWTANHLHRRPVIKTVCRGSATPFRMGMPGRFSAQGHEDGMVLNVVTTKDGKDYIWPVSQTQADSIFVNAEGEFEIPVV